MSLPDQSKAKERFARLERIYTLLVRRMAGWPTQWMGAVSFFRATVEREARSNSSIICSCLYWFGLN